MSLWRSLMVRHSRVHSYGPLVEVLEDRTLLSFITAPTYAAGLSPQSMAVGDFNGDGKLDLVAANPGPSSASHGTVSVLLGKADGTFQAAQSYSVSFDPSSVAVGDFNGDGHTDLAVAVDW